MSYNEHQIWFKMMLKYSRMEGLGFRRNPKIEDIDY
jgi:hypothetical protein